MSQWTTKIEIEARDALFLNSGVFEERLGIPERMGRRLVFPAKEFPMDAIEVYYEEDKKFLGKFFGLVLEGKLRVWKTCPHSEFIELCYSGFFKKGKPYFQTKKGKERAGHPIIDALNNNRYLMELCQQIDLEYMRMIFDPIENMWRIVLRPYGGCFVCVYFPPIKYNVKLPRLQAENMLMSLGEIGKILQKQG